MRVGAGGGGGTSRPGYGGGSVYVLSPVSCMYLCALEIFSRDIVFGARLMQPSFPYFLPLASHKPRSSQWQQWRGQWLHVWWGQGCCTDVTSLTSYLVCEQYTYIVRPEHSCKIFAGIVKKGHAIIIYPLKSMQVQRIVGAGLL